ncbi:DUF6285 domain-containing protein [Pelagibius sp.]|uniref:DUF6285 domain-containing protein n=1 Tax=Pelagibius sp. TaxID=1931238 RepID=UPI00260DE71D|nr:DUF6285 domain-containing protein [Pelagibius sp.]
MKGGEANAAELLRLVEHELANEVLPQLSGDLRYRARLILNAVKIATAELQADRDLSTAIKDALGPLTASAIDAPDTSGKGAADQVQALQQMLRQGELDADPQLFEALVCIAEARCKLVP